MRYSPPTRHPNLLEAHPLSRRSRPPQIRHHAEGEIIVFDDSKMHKAFNDSTGDRLVLIVDMLRPSWIPLGIAEGEHTPELDAFIDAFR